MCVGAATRPVAITVIDLHTHSTVTRPSLVTHTHHPTWRRSLALGVGVTASTVALQTIVHQRTGNTVTFIPVFTDTRSVYSCHAAVRLQVAVAVQTV